MRRSTLVALALALATASANAAMYKWTDQNGNVQYGQFPPTGVAAERISASGTTHKVEAPDGKSPQQRLQQPAAAQRLSQLHLRAQDRQQQRAVRHRQRPD